MKNGFKIPNINKGVAFTIKGPFAHFRKFYSQTSMLSYPIPPRTAICGIIGAILGIDRNHLYSLMQPPNGVVALQLLTPTRKITTTINLISTKKEHKKAVLKKGSVYSFDSSQNRTQIPFEILISKKLPNIKYRIIFWHSDLFLIDKLISYLSKKKTFFPIYLGISEFLASVEFEGITDSAQFLEEYCGTINSVIVADNVISNTLLQSENRFNVEYMLIYMNDDFSSKDYTNVIYSEGAKGLNLGVNYAVKWRDIILTPYEIIKNNGMRDEVSS